MIQIDIRDRILIAVICGCVIVFMSACRKADERPPATKSGPVAVSEKIAETGNVASVVADTNAVLSNSELYEREFKRLVVGSKMTVDDVERGVNKL